MLYQLNLHKYLTQNFRVTTMMDILEFIEGASHVVIYFTFDSTVKLTTLSVHIEKLLNKHFLTFPREFCGNTKAR
ncbi:UDP-glucuronosyltransferase 2B15-like [Aphis craccivora]|uniref:UDP-glucuronosyltransferase 2B15-like n=1 Tax=Aphis craccivora TaxID=307492 RepID=A0A6G0YPC3_APHCR|nr:UDP-glucuronosyltransferase 2B15-like [Aphis craccivora]